MMVNTTPNVSCDRTVTVVSGPLRSPLRPWSSPSNNQSHLTNLPYGELLVICLTIIHDIQYDITTVKFHMVNKLKLN